MSAPVGTSGCTYVFAFWGGGASGREWGGVGGEGVREGWSEVQLTGSCAERLLWDSRPVLEGGVMFGALGPEGLCTKNGP